MTLGNSNFLYYYKVYITLVKRQLNSLKSCGESCKSKLHIICPMILEHPPGLSGEPQKLSIIALSPFPCLVSIIHRAAGRGRAERSRQHWACYKGPAVGLSGPRSPAALSGPHFSSPLTAPSTLPSCHTHIPQLWNTQICDRTEHLKHIQMKAEGLMRLHAPIPLLG